MAAAATRTYFTIGPPGQAHGMGLDPMAMRPPLSSRSPVVNSPHATLACFGIVGSLRVLPVVSVA